MIHSMTGFARRECLEPWGTLVWELRSVNQRYLEVFTRLPEDLRVLESEIRTRVGRSVRRGKIDCTLRFTPDDASIGALAVNRDLVAQLVAATNGIAPLFPNPAPTDLIEVLRWPGALDAVKLDLEPIHRAALQLLNEALEELVETRQREGARMRTLIEQRCATLAEEIKKVQIRLPDVLQRIRARMLNRLAEIKAELDENRLEQEMVIVSQKLDVAEELDRMATHLKEVQRVVTQNQPVGRRLDFLMQELNREANTLGSKSADVETTQASVEMKVLIEQMREQIQNIE